LGSGFQQHDANAYPQHRGCRPSPSTSFPRTHLLPPPSIHPWPSSGRSQETKRRRGAQEVSRIAPHRELVLELRIPSPRTHRISPPTSHPGSYRHHGLTPSPAAMSSPNPATHKLARIPPPMLSWSRSHTAPPAPIPVRFGDGKLPGEDDGMATGFPPSCCGFAPLLNNCVV
jgi:hypothetical protein